VIALRLLDIGFFLFHTVLVLFNVLGWAWKRTRKWNLITLALTAASWFVMGLWFGAGYCVCTDLHWQVRAALGERTDSPSYIHFLIRELTGASLPTPTVNAIAGIGFGIAVTMSVALNIRDGKGARTRRHTDLRPT
jgi:hypothetical protein